jgi:hypothetical protein
MSLVHQSRAMMRPSCRNRSREPLFLSKTPCLTRGLLRLSLALWCPGSARPASRLWTRVSCASTRRLCASECCATAPAVTDCSVTSRTTKRSCVATSIRSTTQRAVDPRTSALPSPLAGCLRSFGVLFFSFFFFPFFLFLVLLWDSVLVPRREVRERELSRQRVSVRTQRYGSDVPPANLQNQTYAQPSPYPTPEEGSDSLICLFLHAISLSELHQTGRLSQKELLLVCSRPVSGISGFCCLNVAHMSCVVLCCTAMSCVSPNSQPVPTACLRLE